ncbi:YdcF family protein [Streptococcus sp. zg-JUN1979]|uniref:YdcF family protein n=1 Tax=Streptococcus sp. zg-JUN1979 TaxID=3391450 RepID=UPI0039A65313
MTGFAIFLACLLFFALVYKVERRNLLIGFAFIVLLLGSLIFVLSLSTLQEFYITYFILAIIAVILVLFILSGPFLFIAVCLYNGTKLLRREGLRVTNLLSLGLGLGIILYLFILPWMLEHFHLSGWFNLLYAYIGGILIYLLIQSALYTLSSVINFINLGKPSLDYIVVLGAGLIGESVTPLLAARIDKGILLLDKHPESKLILSGGQGPDEVISEARAMANYALEKGISKERLILEAQSRNTYENIRFSSELMPEKASFAVVSNYYHIFRALLLAKSQGIKCIGYGAKTKFYFSLNAFIREFVGYMVMTHYRHIALISIYTMCYIMIALVELFTS